MNQRTFTTVALLACSALAVLIATRCEPSAAAPRNEPLVMPRVAVAAHLQGRLPAGVTLRCVPVDGPRDGGRDVTPEADGKFAVDLAPGRWRVEMWRGATTIEQAELLLGAGMTAHWPR